MPVPLEEFLLAVSAPKTAAELLCLVWQLRGRLTRGPALCLHKGALLMGSQLSSCVVSAVISQGRRWVSLAHVSFKWIITLNVRQLRAHVLHVLLPPDMSADVVSTVLVSCRSLFQPEIFGFALILYLRAQNASGTISPKWLKEAPRANSVLLLTQYFTVSA